MFSNNPKINVLRTYVEGNDDFKLNIKNYYNYSDTIKTHLTSRHNTEYDFFSDIIKFLPDNSNSKFLNNGEINSDDIINEIRVLKPDLVITYGCSIIKPKLIDLFKNKIINVHLGLSPYYFGSGTNFHALVNNEFEFFGYTFMYLDEGIDTGEIIHQGRPKIFPYDNPHQIGNRLIKKMTKDFIKLVINFDLIKKKKRVTDYVGRTYKIKDATELATKKMYDNFTKKNLIEFLKSRDELIKKFKIIKQDFIK